MKLTELLGPADVVIGIRAVDLADAATQLLERTLPAHGFAPDVVRRLVDAVAAREREMPTVCETTAIPHARDAGIDDFVAAVAVNREGIVEGQREPRVIFAFLSPDARRSEHLALLASIAQLGRNTRLLDAIAAATTAQDVIALLKG